ncbi:hypothetical protein BH10CYA1_BH10CYA1_49030 [soil metagenome]
MAIETYTSNDVKGSPAPDSKTFDFSKIMAGAPQLLGKDKSEDKLNSSSALDFSGKSLFLCSDTKDEKPKDPNEDKFAKAGYKAYLTGDYKEAEKQYKSLLEVNEKQYGKDSKEVAFTNELLGSTCEKDKRYAEAKTYYKQSAEVTGKASGKDHYDTGLQLNNAARMDHQLKNWKEAAAGYKSAVAILAAEKNGPSSDNGKMTDATTALKSYADVLKELGEKDEAAKQLKRAAEIEKNYLNGPQQHVIYF